MRFSIVVAAALFATPALAFSSKFDGNWSIDLRTTVGECQQEVAGEVTVQEGRIVGSTGEKIEAWGYIEDNGSVVARFTQGQAMLRASGAIKGAKASGAWSSNTNYCGGTWTAQRAK